ncbi:MAG: FtsQ-type POTRA domain-containing protein, partial [Solirubrobacteraceae bacterium]
MTRSIAAPVPRRLAPRQGRLAFGLPRPLRASARATRAGIDMVWAHRRLRIALPAVLIALPLLGGGLWLLRHSSLTAVEHVRVNGLVAVHGADTAAIETALTGAAHGMSTLAVSPARLRAAVASYPIVRTVRVHPSFPHGLRIEVVERP